MEQRKPYANILDLIGHTPMLRTSRLQADPCHLFLKLENANPGGSLKDRTALCMVDDAEASGQIRPGDTLIEATAGNTGIGLALIAARRGYRLKIVMPDKMSPEKRMNLEAMGAEVVLTRSDVAKGHPDYYQDLAERLARDSGAFYVNQFANAANVKAHFQTTGPEIWRQMEGDIDAFVCGVGTGGTLTGAGGYLKQQNPALDIVLADPEGSVLAPLVESGRAPRHVGSWLVEGIGEDYVPENCDLRLVTSAYSISDREAFAAARMLLRREGVMAGSSTGTLLAAALRYCRVQTGTRRVVTLACDTGIRYLGKFYDDGWLARHLKEPSDEEA